MRAVKSLLLGSAATLIATSGSHAADMMVKTKAVEYVRVCGAYGPGFYQIPGTDLCIKIGATARLDAGFNADGNGGPFLNTANGRNDSFDPQDFLFHGRGTLWADARQMTPWGPVRGYVSGAFDGSVSASGGT